MKIYDFDGTIYDGDNTVDFYKYCLKRYPQTRRAIGHAIVGVVLYMFGIINKTAFKERFFSFLRFVPNIDKVVEAFWNTHESKLKNWYLKQNHDSDIIVSASPEFLLLSVCRNLGVTLIGSRVDKFTGKFVGENCHGEEKVNRLTTEINLADCTEFYSDSITDKPLADIIPNSFMVRGDRLIPWCEYKQSAWSRAKHTFFTPEFFVFVFCGGCGTAVNLACSLLYVRWVNDTVAFIGGYFTSLIVTYYLNAKLNYKRKLDFRECIEFIISYSPHFVILVTLVAILLNIYELPRIIVYGLVSLLGLPIAFVLTRKFAFNRTISEDDLNEHN